MLVDGERVAWVGDDATAAPYLDEVSEVVDLEGALVTPAFVDAHVHSTSTGLVLLGLDLTGTTSVGDVLQRLERHVRTGADARDRGDGGAGREGIVLGHGWDETRWPERRPPTRQELDRAAAGAAVYLTRVDVHSAVASSALLEAVPGIRGLAGFDESGRLTSDAHHAARSAALDAVSPAQRRAAQRATRWRAGELGVGAFHELGGPEISSTEDFRSVLDLVGNEPGPDVVGYWGELGGADKARELGALGAAGDLFADGAIGSHTACLRAVYEDAPHTGNAYLTAAQVRDHVVACTEAGLQAGFHAIGDGATSTVLAGFVEAADRVGVERLRAARHRIEHVEMVDAAMIATMAALGIYASVQPQFDLLWGGESGMYAERLGVPRALTLNPFAAMAGAGIPLAFGSDSPVTPIDPWTTIQSAAHHHVPEQRMPVGAAFTAHTRGGWQAARIDDAGLLRPGMLASFAVWETAQPASAALLPDLAVGSALPTCVRTVVRGRTVHAPAGHTAAGDPSG